MHYGNCMTTLTKGLRTVQGKINGHTNLTNRNTMNDQCDGIKLPYNTEVTTYARNLLHWVSLKLLTERVTLSHQAVRGKRLYFMRGEELGVKGVLQFKTKSHCGDWLDLNTKTLKSQIHVQFCDLHDSLLQSVVSTTIRVVRTLWGMFIVEDQQVVCIVSLSIPWNI